MRERVAGRIRKHHRSSAGTEEREADITSCGVPDWVRVSEHRAVTQHSLSSRREELQQPIARVGQHCAQKQHSNEETLTSASAAHGSESGVLPMSPGSSHRLKERQWFWHRWTGRTRTDGEPSATTSQPSTCTRYNNEMCVYIYIYIYI